MSSKLNTATIRSFDLGDDLELALALTLISAVLVFLPHLSDSVLRTAFGLIFLFVPGYAFIAALFPGKSDIDSIERTAFSLAINLALVGLIGIALNFTSWGVRLEPVVASLASLTVLCVAVAGVRRQRIVPDQRFNPCFSTVQQALGNLLPDSDTRFNRIVAAIFILAIFVSAATIAYIAVAPPQKETFTEFYILGTNGQTADYPTNFTLGDQKPVVVGVQNHEMHDQSYTLEVQLKSGTRTTILNSQKIALASDKRWEQSLQVKPDQIGRHMEMQFLLYLDNNSSMPYQETHLWVNVTA